MDSVLELKGAEVVAQGPSPTLSIVPRTKESIDPRVSLSIVEIDPQSSQFACEVTIANTADEDFSVLSVSPRLPRGLKLNEAVDSTEAELTRRYDETCERLSRMLTNALLASSEKMLRAEAANMRATLKQALTFGTLIDVYISALLWRTPRVVRDARKRQLRIEVTSAADAKAAIERFPSIGKAAECELIAYNAELLRAIEREEGFERSRNQNMVLKKGQQYKVIYIVNGRRGSMSPTSFSLSVDMLFQRGEYKVSRMEAATITVPPGPFLLTIIAMIASAIGAYIAPTTGGVQRSITDFSQYTMQFSSTQFLNLLQLYAGPILTALIVYNIFDMTALKSQLAFRRSWRSAIFIGFACGFLNAKILTALSTLLH